MNSTHKSLHFAPVQGHTDMAYRHFHAQIYGGNLIYYTPFIRLEKGSLRPRDKKDYISDLNLNHIIIPQIIFRDNLELNSLIKIFKDLGSNRIDLNMGCPFPLQTGHGRGAATITNDKLAAEIVKAVETNPEIIFSVKMRLGMTDPSEWQSLLPYLNSINLSHITLHPRIAKQQYSGELNLEQFGHFLSQSKNPVIFNGDIKSPEAIYKIDNKFSNITGIMVGRGILGRPSLFSEYLGGKEWEKEKRLEKMLEFHNLLFKHYSSVLCGDSQVISKIQPFWEYSENEIGRKAWKAIKKATNISKYQTAIAMINNI